MDSTNSDSIYEELVLQLQELQDASLYKELSIFINDLCHEMESVEEDGTVLDYRVVHEIIRVFFNATKSCILQVAESALSFLATGFRSGWVNEATLLRGEQRTIYLRAIVCVLAAQFEKDQSSGATDLLKRTLLFLITICDPNIVEDFVACQEDTIEVLSSLLVIISTCLSAIAAVDNTLVASRQLAQQADSFFKISRNATKLTLLLVRQNGFASDVLYELDEHFVSVVHYFVSSNDLPLQLLLGELLHIALRTQELNVKDLHFAIALKKKLKKAAKELQETEEYSEEATMKILDSLQNKVQGVGIERTSAYLSILFSQTGRPIQDLCKHSIVVTVSISPFELGIFHNSGPKLSHIGFPLFSISQIHEVKKSKLIICVDSDSFDDICSDWTGMFRISEERNLNGCNLTLELLFDLETDAMKVHETLVTALQALEEEPDSPIPINARSTSMDEISGTVEEQSDDLKKVSFATTKELTCADDVLCPQENKEITLLLTPIGDKRASFASTKALAQTQKEAEALPTQYSEATEPSLRDCIISSEGNKTINGKSCVTNNRSSIATTKAVSSIQRRADKNSQEEPATQLELLSAGFTKNKSSSTLEDKQQQDETVQPNSCQVIVPCRQSPYYAGDAPETFAGPVAGRTSQKSSQHKEKLTQCCDSKATQDKSELVDDCVKLSRKHSLAYYDTEAAADKQELADCCKKEPQDNEESNDDDGKATEDKEELIGSHSNALQNKKSRQHKKDGMHFLPVRECCTEDNLLARGDEISEYMKDAATRGNAENPEGDDTYCDDMSPRLPSAAKKKQKAIISHSHSKRAYTNPSDAEGISPQPHKRVHSYKRTTLCAQFGNTDDDRISATDYLNLQQFPLRFSNCCDNSMKDPGRGLTNFTVEDCLSQAVQLLRRQRQNKKKRIEEAFLNEMRTVKRKGKKITENQVRRANDLLAELRSQLQEAADSISSQDAVAPFLQDLQSLVANLHSVDHDFINSKCEQSVRVYREVQAMIKQTINDEIKKIKSSCENGNAKRFCSSLL